MSGSTSSLCCTATSLISHCYPREWSAWSATLGDHVSMANLLPAPPPLRCPPLQWANLPSPAGLHDRCRRPRSWRMRAPAAVHAPDQSQDTNAAEQVRATAAQGKMPTPVILFRACANRTKSMLHARALRSPLLHIGSASEHIYTDCFPQHGSNNRCLHNWQATPLNIEGLSREYCDEFSCSSSPAVEYTMRILSRDIQRRGVTRSLYGPTVQYRVSRAAYSVPSSCLSAVSMPLGPKCQQAICTLASDPEAGDAPLSLRRFHAVRPWVPACPV